MQRGNFSNSLGQPLLASSRAGAPARGWQAQRDKLIAILGPAGEKHFTNERAVVQFVGRLEMKGVPLRDHANVMRLFNEHTAVPQAHRTRDPESNAPSAPPEPVATNATGLKAMFAQEGTFNAKSPATIAKFIAFVAKHNVDPRDKDQVASLLPPFLEEVKKAAPPTARELIQAMEAGDAEQVERMLKAGLDPARIVLRPDRPPTRQHLQELASLASNYESAAPKYRGREFSAQAVKVLPSLADLERPKYPGRNALTLALACNAGVDAVSTICLWVADQREAGKACDLLDSPDGQGCTPLIVAVEAGDEACVELLLDHGAKIDLPCPRPNYAYTPLIAAVCKKNQGMTQLLLKEGADPLAVAPDGSSALSLAVKTKNTEALKLLLKALPGRLEQMARTIKEQRTISGSSESAPRFAAVVKKLDDLTEEAARSGDKELHELLRPCHDLAHRLLADDPLESLFLHIKIHQQDPKQAPSELLLESLRQAPAEWGRRLALTSEHASQDGPIHSEDLERFYREVSGLAPRSGFGGLVRDCIVSWFEVCGARVNMHDGAKLLELMEREDSVAPLLGFGAFHQSVRRIYRELTWLWENQDANVIGTQQAASLATAVIASRKITDRHPGERSGVLYLSDLTHWCCDNLSLADLKELIRRMPDGRHFILSLRESFLYSGWGESAAAEPRGDKIAQVSSKGSATAAAALFLDAFRIATSILYKGVPDDALSAWRLIRWFSLLTSRGRQRALNQLSAAEFSTFSAMMAARAGEYTSVMGTSGFKAVQEFQQGRSYMPPPADSALFKAVINQIRDIEKKHVGNPDLRANAVAEAICRRIRQFIMGVQSTGSEEFFAQREAIAQTFVDLLSLALPEDQKMAALAALSPQELLTVRSWFDEDNDTTRAIDALYAERTA